jgi:hypothetical protein
MTCDSGVNFLKSVLRDQSVELLIMKSSLMNCKFQEQEFAVEEIYL